MERKLPDSTNDGGPCWEDYPPLLTIAHAAQNMPSFRLINRNAGSRKNLTHPVELAALLRHTRNMSDVNDGYDAVRDNYPAILTTAQVAEMLDLNVRTVLNMAGDGRLPASRLAGSRKFHYVRDQIIETLIENTVDPATEAKKKTARAKAK